jgi:hypothetical protein
MVEGTIKCSSDGTSGEAVLVYHGKEFRGTLSATGPPVSHQSQDEVTHHVQGYYDDGASVCSGSLAHDEIFSGRMRASIVEWEALITG